MAITSLDLQYNKSQRMTDFDDGGGRMTSNQVIDNQLNNVFSDRSDLDGIIGRLSLRKIYFFINTPSDDTLLGAFSFLTDLPLDENVNVCMFNTDSYVDMRIDAQHYIESYRIQGVKSQYILYGTHLVGQQTIQVYCREQVPTPDVGDVLCLSVEKVGYDPNVQFVAVKRVASRVTTTFTDTSGDFVRDVLIIEITTALQYQFEGQQDPTRLTGVNNPPTVVRYTQVADSAKYYGMKACVDPPGIGDLVVTVDNPFIPLVPSNRSSTPLVDQIAGLGSVTFIPAGAVDSLTFSGNVTTGAGTVATRYLGNPFQPGSLTLTIGSVVLSDDGSGGIVPVDPLNVGWTGFADYQTGSFGIGRDVNLNSTVTATATPAGMIIEQNYSKSIKITPANRFNTHVVSIPGQSPSPGTVYVEYIALGRWIRLRDNGRGQITGNPGEGSGTINYNTGSIAVTLGALPDVDSAIIIAWGTDNRGQANNGLLTIPDPSFRIQLENTGMVPGTLEIEWLSGGVTKTATAAASGAITGDATGNVDATASVVEFTTAFSLDPGQEFQFSYDIVDPSLVHSEVFTPSVAGHHVTVTLAHPPEPNSVVARWSTAAPGQNGGQGYRRNFAAKDNGVGGWTGAPSGTNTIDYGDGDISLRVD